MNNMTKPNNYEEVIKKFDKLFPLRYNGSTYRLEPGGENRKTIADFILKKVIPKAEAIGIEKGKEMEREKIIEAIEKLNKKSRSIYKKNLMTNHGDDLANDHASAIAIRNEIIEIINLS